MDLVLPGRSYPAVAPKETVGSPSFPRDPISALPCSPTPGERPCLTKAALQYCPRYSKHEGFPSYLPFEAPSHGFTDCASGHPLVTLGIPTLEGGISDANPGCFR